MLPASIHKGLDIAEGLGSIFTTKASGHLEFGFQTPSSPFGLIVGERDLEVMQEHQDPFFVVPESFEQSPDGTFARPSSFVGLLGRPVSVQGCRDNLVIFLRDLIEQVLRCFRYAFTLEFLDFNVGRLHKLLHLPGAGRVAEVVNEVLDLPVQMGTAECMLLGELCINLQVGSPEIGDCNLRRIFHPVIDTKGLDALVPAVLMEPEYREELAGSYVQPPVLLLNPAPGLIEMCGMDLCKGILELLNKAIAQVGTLADDVAYRAVRHPDAEGIIHERAYLVHADTAVQGELGHNGVDGRSVLERAFCESREPAALLGAVNRAAQAHLPVFSLYRPDFNINNSPGCLRACPGEAFGETSASGALVGIQILNPVRRIV